MRVISFHTQHDANVAVTEDGQPILVLELERIFETRYFDSSSDPAEFRAQWARALDVVRRHAGREPFDLGVTSWVMPGQRRILAELVSATRWVTVHHHRAHASAGFQDSPFERALVVSFDGGGSDGTFSVFRAARERELELVERIPLNLGTPYRALGTAMPEVTAGRPQPRAGHLALAGKLMAYAALGQRRPEWEPALRDYYQRFQEPRQALYSLGEDLGLPLDADALEPARARDLAATSQGVFEDLAAEVVKRHSSQVEVDGLVLTGGCALNVVLNDRLRRAGPLPVHVPPAPNDAGIALGAAWTHDPSSGRSQTVFLGPPLDEDVPVEALRDRGARPSTPELVAAVLARGAVVGVARGRCEIGPRALGHRSILGDPRDPSLRDRLNGAVKFREAYRPFAPVVAAEHAGVLASGVRSPFMSFAVALGPEARRRFPAITHIDGTARIQTLEPGDDAWLHAVLTGFARHTGAAVLLNTSFNTRGQPLLQRASTALELLDTTGIDFVVLGELLIPKDPATIARFPEAGA